jgi:hypothetical protein
MTTLRLGWRALLRQIVGGIKNMPKSATTGTIAGLAIPLAVVMLVEYRDDLLIKYTAIAMALTGALALLVTIWFSRLEDKEDKEDRQALGTLLIRIHMELKRAGLNNASNNPKRTNRHQV